VSFLNNQFSDDECVSLLINLAGIPIIVNNERPIPAVKQEDYTG
jgi:hypothetical protein